VATPRPLRPLRFDSALTAEDAGDAEVTAEEFAIDSSFRLHVLPKG
jgi:hypothetical protein